MSRVRLRPAHEPNDLARIYATPHDHRKWHDHHLRVNTTIEVAKWLAASAAPVIAAADLSCGNGAILSAVPVANRRVFGDFAPGHEFTGPIEETIEQIPDVDLFVCSETIEHLDDPGIVLKAIRGKTRQLVVSTPVDAWHDDNLEHYWAWDRAGVEEMLTAAGFETTVYTAVDFRPMGLPYCFGIWGCR
jgi:hypothetical protein